MNNESRELIHKLLDGEVQPDNEVDLISDLCADPGLKKELLDLKKTITLIESGERLTAGKFFTSEVMRKLPVRKSSYLQSIWDFLFASRVLKWNVATVAATACLFIVLLSGLSNPLKKLYSVSPVSYREDSSVMVRINFYAPEAQKVALAGDFNKWDPERNPLQRQGNGIWTIEVPLKPGVYKYMFVVDNKVWVADPHAETYRDDGFGLKNAVLRVNAI